jgi:O-antigen ligase
MYGKVARDLFRKPQPRTLAAGSSRNSRVRVETLVALGLWFLLWGGYNTGLWYWQDPQLSTNFMVFAHAVRAFSPMLAGWIAFLILLTRPTSVLHWLPGPLGLLLLFAIIGLVSSVVFSRVPSEGIYWGANYLSIVLVLLVVVSGECALPDVKRLLVFNWIVASVLTAALLGALPFLGGFASGRGEAHVYTESAVRQTYNGGGIVLGMAMTRNTGFARYAAIAALAAMARLRSGRRLKRIVWAAVFLISFYSLVLSNGRTEIAAFIISAFLILYADKSRRVAYLIAGFGVALLLGLRGFYSAFFDYFTRTGHLDMTMTGRTVTWQQGLRLLKNSPWIGWGFQADRIFLSGQHMHNAFIAALVQSGVIGGGAAILAIGLTWYLIVKYFYVRRAQTAELLPVEIPGVFMFVTISSVAESTFAYFSAAWLLSAPVLAYVLVLNRQIRMRSVAAERAKSSRLQFARRQLRERNSEASSMHSA